MENRHALVIGGTGMLKNVSLWLAEKGYKTSVIGRSEHKHRDLVNQATKPELINSIKVDYNDKLLLEKAVRESIEKHGPISLVVSWTPAYSSLELVDVIVSEHCSRWKLFQVKGSRRYFKDKPLDLSSSCVHRKIYLGFIMEAGHSRWLTKREIADGVIKSVKNDSEESIVGRLHPYEKRPGY